MFKKSIRVSGSVFLNTIMALALTACGAMSVKASQSSVWDRVLEFHKADRLRQAALAIVPLVEASVSQEIANGMRVDADKALVLFTSTDVWFYEAGGWRLYFDESLNLKRIQYYQAAEREHEGMRLIADVNNRQVEWQFGGIVNGQGLVPRVAATADVYVVKNITVSILALAVDGNEVTGETIAIAGP